MNKKVLIIIPAFNEEKSIKNVINQTRKVIPAADIIVINDGSIDNTGFFAEQEGAIAVNLPVNLGIGGAMQTGYLYAHYYNYDIAVQVDGDGQHDPSYINSLLQPLLDDTADIVIGSRFLETSSYKSPLGRKMGIIFFAKIISFLINQKLTDTTSGFRAVNKKLIDCFSCRYPLDYPEVDVLIKLYKNRFRITEIPVSMNSRVNGRSSITPIKSLYYMAKVTLAIIVNSLRSKEYC